MLRKKHKIFLTQEANVDLHDLIRFYRKLLYKLAKGLVLELDESFKFLSQNPYSNTLQLNKTYYTKDLRKYPVQIFYVVEDSNIIILAIKHKNFHPNYWIERV